MEQLNGVDYYFFAAEQRRMPHHIAHLRIYDPSTAKTSVVRFKDILNRFEQRLHLSPLFRKQLVKVPFDLDYPYFIESPDFNIEAHVRHIALPKPGDWRQLCILIARLHSHPLNQKLPLWEAYVIEGLNNIEGMPEGAFAVLIKAHHAIADGATFDKMLEAIHDENVKPGKLKESSWKPEPVPTNTELLINTLGNYIKQPPKSFNRLKSLASSIQRGRKFEEENPEVTEKQQQLTIFNTVASANKVFGAILIDLADLKAIKDQVPGATINDAVLTISSYCLSSYLAHHGKSIDESLRVGFPMNTRGMGEYSDGYNHAAPMFQSLHTDIDDPIERLAAINASTKKSKAYLEVVGPDRMRNVLEAIPGFALTLGFNLAGRYELMANQTTGCHLFVTNVPGPRSPRYLAGAKALCSFGLAPTGDSTGLMHMVSSYLDRVSISFQSCRTMMPDPEFYQECLQDAFELVVNGTQNQQRKKPSKAS